MENNAFIDIHDVTMYYHTRDENIHALQNVSFQVAQAEFVAIVGPSGCGKSTLLLLVAGLIAATGGEIYVAGKRVARPQTEIGIVFQNPVLLDWRSALNNVLLQAEMRNLDMAAARQKASELLKSVGLAGFESKYPYELSGGMQQRTAICRALLHDPPLLLMDEPFGALDALTRQQLRVDIERLWVATHKTVLLVTHSISEAVQLADRVIVMSPRPGSIERVFDIDLPRPRNRAVQESPQFNEYIHQITDIFMARGILYE